MMFGTPTQNWPARGLVTLAVMAFAMGACGDGSNGDADAESSPASPAQVATDGGAVTISADGFDPESLEVDVGTEIIFTNEDGPDRMLAINEGEEPVEVAAGDEFRITFDEPGAYIITFTDDPGFTATIMVSGNATEESGEEGDGE